MNIVYGEMKEMSRKNETLLLALPVIMENILQTLLGTTDTYFAGQMADEAIAGIGVTNLIMNLFISFFTAVSVGTTAITARAFGAGDREKVNRTVVHSMALVLGIAVGLRAVKDTRTPMYVTGGSNILNIGLNLLFIRMGLGIFGMGLATTLSRAAGAAVLFLRLKRSDSIRLHRCSLQGDEIAAVGIPAGMEKLIMRMGQLVYNAMILSLGTAAYVAHNVAGTIESYSYIPAMGFGLPGVWSAYAMDITVRGLLLLHRFQKGVFSKTVNGV